MQQRPVLGATLLVLGMGAFAVSDGLAKLMADHFSAAALTWFRYLGLFLTVVPLIARQPRVLRTGQPLAQVLRAAGLIGAAVFFLLGLAAIPQAEATAMVFASPLFVLILSRFLMREAVGIRGFAPVLLGFVGVLVVVRPGSFHFGGAEVFPLLSSMAWAGAVVLTRQLSTTDSVSTTMVYSAALGVASLSLVVPGIDWSGLRHTWPLMLAMTAAWCAAQWLVVAAYQVASPPVIAPFAYSQLLWAAVFGLIFAHHWPDAMSLLGMLLIVLSGLYAAWLARARA